MGRIGQTSVRQRVRHQEVHELVVDPGDGLGLPWQDRQPQGGGQEHGRDDEEDLAPAGKGIEASGDGLREAGLRSRPPVPQPRGQSGEDDLDEIVADKELCTGLMREATARRRSRRRRCSATESGPAPQHRGTWPKDPLPAIGLDVPRSYSALSATSGDRGRRCVGARLDRALAGVIALSFSVSS